jgi:hypothetical protein
MDIVTIQLEGYGCEITNGKITKKDYDFLKNLDNLWIKNLRTHIKKYININKESHNYGILKGDLKIEVNGKTIMDLPTSILETQNMIFEETEIHPKSDSYYTMTSLQHMEGTICDTTFILDEEFDISKLTLIKKQIKTKLDNVVVSDLICGMYYKGTEIPFGDTITDLRMSELFFDKPDEKNQYR